MIRAGLFGRGSLRQFSSEIFSTTISSSSKKLIPGTYTLFKNKSAVQFSVIGPEISTKNGYSSVKKAGSLLCTFAHGLEGRPGYDWSTKVSMSLSVAELGDFLDKSITGIQFQHEPKYGAPSAGQIVKTLSLTHATSQYTMRFTVEDKMSASKNEFVIPISRGELIVLKTVVERTIPKLLGFE
jgi:hypothetical protein